MDGGSFTLRWEDDSRAVENGSNVVSEEIICDLDSGQSQHFSNMTSETLHSDADHAIAAENLMFLAHDIVGQMSYVDAVSNTEEIHQSVDDEIECQVTEEVITDDWVEPGGQERIEVPLEHVATSAIELNNEENDIDVPLPTDQDEYTAMRPWPCDFCSRRFRKKAALMNHMVAHQNDRPYGCNLCGVRYVRRADLMNHLKIHAYVPEDTDDIPNDYDDFLVMEQKPAITPRKRKGGRGRRKRHIEENGRTSYSPYIEEEQQGSARTQQYSRPIAAPPPLVPPAPPPPLILPTDPRKPFVCQHCGVGFAREKALASHSRIHGGDSPLECSICGELCWSREALAQHTRNRHPHLPPPDDGVESDFSLDESTDEQDIPRSRTAGGMSRGPELFCQDCGAAFQRADLLRRHAVAAHSYKREVIDTSLSEDNNAWGDMHNCGVCGEGFRDALDLLAHAESHARTNMYRCWRCGSVDPSHSCSIEYEVVDGGEGDLSDSASNRISVNSSTALVCTFCGKAFRSRARFKRHIALHRSRGTSPSTCATCGQRFSDSRALATHRLAHHPQHHNSGNNKQFPCRECGKMFGSRSSQQIHIRIHTGERPYGCRFCWKAFADGGTLRKHERIHTGEKPYACAVCPRAFNQRVVLREHVRSHHGGGVAASSETCAGRGLACCVCGRHLPSSADLVQHLIQHCDANTALNRQPQVGPRKYKRRRKLKPHDVDMSNASGIGGGDSGSDEGLEVENNDSIVPRRNRRNRISFSVTAPTSQDSLTGTDSHEVYENFTLQDKIMEPVITEMNFAPKTRAKNRKKSNIGGEGGSNKAKMIHTQRKRLAAGGRRRGRAAQVTRAAAAPDVAAEPVPLETDSRVRPRTKNVRYHEPPARPPQAIFPAPTDLADDLRAILLPPIKTEASSGSDTESKMVTTVTVYDFKQEPDAGAFRCEMCSESFPARDQLLLHVPVHI